MDNVNRRQAVIPNLKGLLQFPDEILLQILLNLDAWSLVRVSAVSQRLHSLAYNRSLWRHVTCIYRTPAVNFQWEAHIWRTLRLYSRLVEQTPLRHECLRSFSILFSYRGNSHIGRYEVAKDLMVLTTFSVINLALAQFRYAYHLTTDSFTTSGGLPCLLPPGTTSNEISSMSMPTLVDRLRSTFKNRYWFGVLLTLERRGDWLFSV